MQDPHRFLKSLSRLRRCSSNQAVNRPFCRGVKSTSKSSGGGEDSSSSVDFQLCETTKPPSGIAACFQSSSVMNRDIITLFHVSVRDGGHPSSRLANSSPVRKQSGSTLVQASVASTTAQQEAEEHYCRIVKLQEYLYYLLSKADHLLCHLIQALQYALLPGRAARSLSV